MAWICKDKRFLVRFEDKINWNKAKRQEASQFCPSSTHKVGVFFFFFKKQT